MKDWNWFFSSVAQSIASLDGTLIAFIIAKLINSQGDHSRKVAKAEELIRRAVSLKDAASIRYFDWYNRRLIDAAIYRAYHLVHVEYDQRPADQIIATLTLPEYMSRQEAFEAIMAGVGAREDEARKREEREKTKRRSTASDLYGFPQVPRIKSGAEIQAELLRDSADERELSEETEALRRLRVAVSESIRDVSAMKSEMTEHPEWSSLIRAVLVASLCLFSFSVIYPLSFLPLPQGWTPELSVRAFFQIIWSLRGVILVVAVLAFGGLLIVLWRANEALRYPQDLLTRLGVWVDEGAYSQHLKNWRMNTDAQAKAVPR